MENILINVDSQFRDKIKYPNAGHFVINLEQRIKNIAYIRLSSSEIPNLFYTFKKEYDNMSFIYYDYTSITSGGGETEFQINNLIILLNQQLASQQLASQHLEIIADNNHIIIQSTKPFNICFRYDDSKDTLGYRLGFSEDRYTSLYNTSTNTYFIKSENQYTDDNVSGAFYVMNTPYTYAIQENGNYTVGPMMSLFNKNNKKLQILLDTNTARVTIVSKSLFNLDFTNNSDEQSLGYHLGFRNNTYTSNYTPQNITINIDNYNFYITAEAPIDVVGDPYLFLKVNDYGKIYNLRKTNNTIIQNMESYLGKIIINTDKGTRNYDNNNFITKMHIFRKPENIQSLDITLFDPSSKIVDMIGMDFSFTLEIGVIYNSALYQKYIDEYEFRLKLLKTIL